MKFVLPSVNKLNPLPMSVIQNKGVIDYDEIIIISQILHYKNLSIMGSNFENIGKSFGIHHVG